MKYALVLGVSLCAINSAPILAKEPEAAKTTQDDAKPKKEKKICRTEKMTGSLTRVRRTCMTQSEWDELAAATKKDVDRYTNDANGRQAPAASPFPQ